MSHPETHRWTIEGSRGSSVEVNMRQVIRDLLIFSSPGGITISSLVKDDRLLLCKELKFVNTKPASLEPLPRCAVKKEEMTTLLSKDNIPEDTNS